MNNEIVDLALTVHELLINLNKRIEDMSGAFKRSGILEEERLLNLLDDLQSLAEGIEAISKDYPNLDLEEYREKLLQLTDALEGRDTSLFFDLLQYELNPVLNYWSDCLKN